MNQYAYLRVSSKDQNLDRQLAVLEPFHLPKKNIFCDYQSGNSRIKPSFGQLRLCFGKKEKPFFKNSRNTSLYVFKN